MAAGGGSNKAKVHRDTAIWLSLQPLKSRVVMTSSQQVLSEPVAAAIDGTDRTLWLNTYHKRINEWRTSIRREAKPSASLLQGLAAVLDDAERVYTELLFALLRHLDETDELASRALSHEAVRLRFCSLAGPDKASSRAAALRAACGRCYIYIGDVARYRRLHLPAAATVAAPHAAAPFLELLHTACPTECRHAARCYVRALLISPAQAGSAYNQLAVLAGLGNDRAVGIVCYLCALTTTKPFEVAHANLAQLIAKVPALTTVAQPAAGVAPSLAQRMEEAGRLTDVICAAITRLHMSAVGTPATSVGDSEVATALDAAIGRLGSYAHEGVLPSHRVQPLLLTGLCVAHHLAPTPNSTLRVAMDALLHLTTAVSPMLPATSSATRDVAEGDGGGDGMVLIDVMDESAAEGAAGMADDDTGTPPDAALYSEARVLEGLLPVLMWLSAAHPSLLLHATDGHLAAFGAALRDMGLHEGGTDAAAQIGLDEARLTSLHLSLLGLEPMVASLQQTAARARQQYAANQPCAVAESTGASASGLAACVRAQRAHAAFCVQQLVQMAGAPPTLLHSLRRPVAEAEVPPQAETHLHAAPPPAASAAGVLAAAPATSSSIGSKRGVRTWEKPFGVTSSHHARRAGLAHADGGFAWLVDA